MTINELIGKGAIYIKNIRDGFDEYKHVSFTMDQQTAFKRLQELVEVNGEDCAFVDFYYFRLNEDEQIKVWDALDDADLEYLEAMEAKLSADLEVFFPLSSELLKIVTKLNATGMLFSTIYFTKYRNTWWGNYDQEYVVFGIKE